VTTILVVENDPDVSDFLTNVLQAELAAVVRSASTGTLGAEAIETGAFDLAIIDMLTPEVSGYDLANAPPPRMSLHCYAPGIRMPWPRWRSAAVLI
jgi:DNA-binding response OmpR family regulator